MKDGNHSRFLHFKSALKTFFLSGLILVVFAFQGISQDIDLKGIVIDKITKEPIESVYIAWDKSETTLTNTHGEFNIKIQKFPITLTLSHVSYGLTQISLKEKPSEPFYIRLDPKVSKIDEVQVSGERLRILTKNKDFSIQDFAFDRNSLWLLGFLNNQANQQRLFLANPYGDTIKSIPVNRAEQLFEDVFGSIHLFLNDSVYQLFSKGDSILFLYGTSRKRFTEAMEGILCAFNDKLVFKNASRYNMELYYLTMDDPDRHHLTFISDTVAQSGSKQDRKRDAAIARWGLNEWLANMWTTVGRYSKSGSKFNAVVSPPIPMELFVFHDSLFILNFLKDSLLCFSPEGTFQRSVKIDFHKEVKLGGIDYRDLEFIQDPITQKIYLIERKIAGWLLYPLDQQSGTLFPQIQLPDFAGMSGIRAYNDAIYFLYQEKLHPYYTRLYRYQL